MRRLVYAYFVLLIFEGALRKWALPSLEGPLLIIRDPLVACIYGLALRRGIWPWDRWMLAVIALTILSLLASLAVGCPLMITLFGERTDYWQIPLILLLPEIFTREDVKRIGRWMLLLLPGMAVLALFQFRAGPGHWLNATTGGGANNQAQQLYAAAGRVRPSGTFSFVTGMVSFLALGSAFIFQGFLIGAGRRLLWPATVALVLALGISGSRSAILYVAIVAVAAGVASIHDPARLRRTAAPLAAALLAYGMLHFFSDFRAGLNVERTRFDSAGGLQEGILYRWLGDMRLAWESEWSSPLLGRGLGIGTNVGAGLATGSRQFLLAEGEWARVIEESGPVLGLAFITLRVAIAIRLLRYALRALRARDDVLPLLLLAAGSMDLVLGQWGQSTVSGFAVFTAGICFAAGKNEVVNEEDHEEVIETPEPKPPLRRGRAVYAAAIKDRRP
jgi:hypothetical protein